MAENVSKPKLYNCVNLNESWGDWCNFLGTCELKDEKNGYSWYCYANCHYFLFPDGSIIGPIFGYHGRNFWYTLHGMTIPPVWD